MVGMNKEPMWEEVMITRKLHWRAGSEERKSEETKGLGSLNDQLVWSEALREAKKIAQHHMVNK